MVFEILMFAGSLILALAIEFGALAFARRFLPSSPAGEGLAWVPTVLVAFVLTIAVALLGHSFWPEASWIFYLAATVVLGALFIDGIRRVIGEVRTALQVRNHTYRDARSTNDSQSE